MPQDGTPDSTRRVQKGTNLTSVPLYVRDNYKHQIELDD